MTERERVRDEIADVIRDVKNDVWHGEGLRTEMFVNAILKIPGLVVMADNQDISSTGLITCPEGDHGLCSAASHSKKILSDHGWVKIVKEANDVEIES